MIERELEELLYTFGLSFDIVDDCQDLSLLHVRKNMDCNTPIEVPYYGAGLVTFAYIVEVVTCYLRKKVISQCVLSAAKERKK